MWGVFVEEAPGRQSLEFLDHDSRHAFDLGPGNGQRGDQVEGGSQGTEKESGVPDPVANDGHLLRVVERLPVRVAKVEGRHKSQKAHVDDKGKSFEGFPDLPDRLPFGGNSLQDFFLFKGGKGREGNLASQGVGCIAVTVIERSRILFDRLVDLFGHDCRGEGKISSRQAFSQDEHVGNDALLFTGEKGSRSSKPCGDLVQNQGKIEVSTTFGQFRQVPGGPDNHSSGRLEEGFQDDRQNFPVVVLQDPGGDIGAFKMAGGRGKINGASVAIRSGSGNGPVDQRTEHLVKAINSSHPHRSQSVAMVGSVKRKKGGRNMSSLATSSLVLEKEREFQCNFDRRRPVVGIEDPPESGRSQFHKPFGKADGRLVSRPEKGRMGDRPELGDQSPVQGRMAMAKNVDPKGGRSVEEPTAPVVNEPDSFSPRDDGRILPFPGGQGGERVPEDLPVPGHEIGMMLFEWRILHEPKEPFFL